MKRTDRELLADCVKQFKYIEQGTNIKLSSTSSLMLEIELNLKSEIEKPIDKVTVNNLDLALRTANINVSKHILDKVIDLVELLEVKGDKTTIKDICKLQKEWGMGLEHQQ